MEDKALSGQERNGRASVPGVIRFFRDERRVVMSLIGLIGVFALGAGIVQIRRTVNAPFNLPFLSDLQNSAAGLNNDVAALQKKDTDQDSLNDFDELYVYNSSPYLKDSDSDNVEDAAEVDAGSDPNCPLGKTCGSAEPTEEEIAGGNELDQEQLLDSGPNAEAFEAILNQGEVSAEQMRTLLKNSGAPETTVQGLSDDAIMSLFANNTGGEADIEALQNLSANDIRVLLKGSGGDAATVDAMDDETLVTIFRQGLDQQYNLNP